MPPSIKRSITDHSDQYDAAVDTEMCLPPANTAEVTWTTWDADTVLATSSWFSEAWVTTEPPSSFWTSTLSSMTSMSLITGTTPTSTGTSLFTAGLPSTLSTITTSEVMATSTPITTVKVTITSPTFAGAATSSTTVIAEAHPSNWPGTGGWALLIYNSSDCIGQHNNLSMTGQTFDYMGWNSECHDVNYTNLDPSFTKSMSWRVYNGNCTVYDTNACWWQSKGRNESYYSSSGCLNSAAGLHDVGITDVGKWAAVKCIAKDIVPPED